MNITRRCDYACRILRAAYLCDTPYISVAHVSELEEIPYAFARSIQHDLVKAGLLKTVRGAHGGLALDCDPEKVTLLEVLEAIQGAVSISLCTEDFECCSHQTSCAYNKLWQGADELFKHYLASITLAGLFEQGVSHPSINHALSLREEASNPCA